MAMTIKDFRRIALSFEGAKEGSHMGAVDFPRRRRIFCTLAHGKKGYGNLMLNPEQQAMFVEELPEISFRAADGTERRDACGSGEGERRCSRRGGGARTTCAWQRMQRRQNQNCPRQKRRRRRKVTALLVRQEKQSSSSRNFFEEGR